MEFDVFFSISQTPNDGVTPSEREMFENFFAEVEAADALGLKKRTAESVWEYGRAWLRRRLRESS